MSQVVIALSGVHGEELKTEALAKIRRRAKPRGKRAFKVVN